MAMFESVVLALINNWLSRPQKPGGVRLAGLWLLAAACLLTTAGLIYLLIAANTCLVAFYGPVVGPLLTGLGSFVLAGIAAIGWTQAQKKPAPQPSMHNDTMIQTAEALFAALEHATKGLEEPIADNPRTSVALASLAGYMAANKVH